MINAKSIKYCSHCQQEVLNLQHQEQDLFFCCSGCLLAFKLINNSNLSNYYQIRNQQSTDNFNNLNTKISKIYIWAPLKTLNLFNKNKSQINTTKLPTPNAPKI